MLETTAYFESYRHVLESLVSFEVNGEEEFPFKDQIVFCNNKHIPKPKYLEYGRIDFRPLVDKQKKLKHSKDSDTGSEYEFSEAANYARHCLVANEETWPSREQLDVDQSQYEALKLALKNQLTLIQGPPGTGKTFIGVKLVQLLLHNRDAWWTKNEASQFSKADNKATNHKAAAPEIIKHKPILMICYTNHALDQFLQLCVKECGLSKGVIRVGGRCKDPSLYDFLLKNVKMSQEGGLRDRDRDYRIGTMLYEERKKLEDSKKTIEKSARSLDSCENGVLSLETLLVIAHELNMHLSGLQSDRDLLFWLDLFPDLLSDEHVYYKQNYDTDEEEEDWNSDEIEEQAEAAVAAAKNNQKINDKSVEKKMRLVNDEQDDSVILADLFKSSAIDGESLSEAETIFTHEEEKEEDYLEDENDERMLEDDLIAQENIDKAMRQINDISKLNLFEISGILDLNKMFDLFTKSKDNSGFLLKLDYRSEQNFKEKMLSKLKQILNKNNDEGAIIIEKLLEKSRVDGEYFLDFNKINDMNERHAIYNYLLNNYRDKQQRKLFKSQDDYNESATRLKELKMQSDRMALESALIIAMTTTGSARYHDILRDIGPRIVIVEEAAEVFEAHIISALSKQCEHLILIGDHVQLRPSPTVYTLAKNFSIDVSLFERLLKNDASKQMLKCQHRMRPEISVLMRHFYNEAISDHEIVKTFPNVIGVRANIYFMNHNQMETNSIEDKSRSNLFEAQFVARFCKYLVKNNHKPANISVLTMYLGQLVEIRKELKQLHLPDLKVYTVDNYQGEENDIVILSLVRSNNQDSIGFVAIENRICVALSRARHGLYCIGNFDLICQLSRKWAAIIEKMKAVDSFGDGIPLTCYRHPENDVRVQTVADFLSRAEGGCHLPCMFRLKCGHVCTLKCHSYDPEHEDCKCLEVCNTFMENCGHYCKSTCGHAKTCAEICSTLVEKTIAECGHTVKLKCSKTPKKEDCSQQCCKPLKCGHNCLRRCGDNTCEPCISYIKVSTICHHETQMNVKCSEKIYEYQRDCPKICQQPLDCSHLCASSCRECYGGYVHAECAEKCGRLLVCGHACLFPCSNQCPPCQSRCENSCFHSRCSGKCSEQCPPCRMPCVWRCRHQKCTRLCHEICDREPCNEWCRRKLSCGHRCIGLCGEVCPPLCRICNRDQVQEIFFGTEDEKNARFIYLLDCRHVVEVSGMDNWISSRYDEDYDRDSNNNNNSKNSIQLPECPKCRTPIRKNFRYSKYIKQQLANIEQIKLKSNQYKSAKDIKEEIESFVYEELPNRPYFKQMGKLFKFSDKLEAKKEHEDDELVGKGRRTNSNWRKAVVSELKSHVQLLSYKNRWELGFIWCKLAENCQKAVKDPEHLKHLEYELNKVKNLIDSDKATKEFISEQRAKEIMLELRRVEKLIELFAYRNQLKNLSELKSAGGVDQEYKTTLEKGLNELEELLFRKIRRYDQVEKRVSEIFGTFKPVGTFYAPITQAEREAIHKAMNFGKGHWFKCPNGHIYSIGECGGAMERSLCPECKSVIGGEDHTLTTTNTLASEMDGATHAAWSEEANNQYLRFRNRLFHFDD